MPHAEHGIVIGAGFFFGCAGTDILGEPEARHEPCK